MIMSKTTIDTMCTYVVMIDLTIAPIAGDVLHHKRIVFHTGCRQHTCVCLRQAVH